MPPAAPVPRQSRLRRHPVTPHRPWGREPRCATVLLRARTAKETEEPFPAQGQLLAEVSPHQPPQTPSHAAPRGSQVRPSGYSGYPPPPQPFPAPQWLQPRSRRLQSASEGVSCFHLPAYGTGGILAGSRNPAAAGERPRPAVSIALCLGSRGKTTRSYFGFYGSGESPRPSAGSEGEAPRQGLNYPQDPHGEGSVPSVH